MLCEDRGVDGPNHATTNEASLLRIQQVSAGVGLTRRTIRYYEELGLLKPAARSKGSYRLYDLDDVERLRFIKSLRDEGGFSLSEIGQLLEDQAGRTPSRQHYRATADPGERRAMAVDALGRVDRQIDIFRRKISHLEAMVTEAEGRRKSLAAQLAVIAHDSRR